MNLREALKKLERQNREIKRLREDLEEFSTCSLTKMKNRTFFEKKIEKRLNRSYRFLFVDADGLKFVNDHLGHHAGDQLIQKISSVVKETTSESDFAVRWAGDEFLICCKNNRLESLERELERKFSNCMILIEGTPIRVRASIGSGDSIASADRNMYTKKSHNYKKRSYGELNKAKKSDVRLKADQVI